jgi:hypothetical protein
VRLTLALVALGLGAPLAAQDQGQAGGPPPDRTIDAAERRTVIDGIIARLKQNYVFPDSVALMERALRERQRNGAYERITSALAFADSLTAHLQAASHDRHIRVRFSADPLPVLAGPDDPDPVRRERQRTFGRQVNFGFERVERLEGNVGYLEIRSFGFSPEDIADVAAAAFTFLVNTDALIIDVRRNGGGSPFMVAHVASYLFGPEPVLLNSLYWRPGNRTDDFYTARDLRGTRYGADKPVYVLTSRNTFSGAEEFAYDLQTRKRAVIVGDTTGGGAHPGGIQRVTEHFGVFVPTGRAINPITKTDWERVGVRPDIPVASDQALRTAHLAALRGLRSKATDAERQRALDQAIADVERERN